MVQGIIYVISQKRLYNMNTLMNMKLKVEVDILKGRIEQQEDLTVKVPESVND